MPFGDDFKDVCNDTATWEPLDSRDRYNVPSYGPSSPLNNVRRNKEHRLVRNAQGDEVISSENIWIVGGTIPAITPEGRITLSDGSAPKILSVELPQDDDGSVSHAKVFFE